MKAHIESNKIQEFQLLPWPFADKNFDPIEQWAAEWNKFHENQSDHTRNLFEWECFNLWCQIGAKHANNLANTHVDPQNFQSLQDSTAFQLCIFWYYPEKSTQRLSETTFEIYSARTKERKQKITANFKPNRIQKMFDVSMHWFSKTAIPILFRKKQLKTCNKFINSCGTFRIRNSLHTCRFTEISNFVGTRCMSMIQVLII